MKFSTKKTRCGELLILPGIVDSQQSEVVTLWLFELGLALVRYCLLVLTPGRSSGKAHTVTYRACTVVTVMHPLLGTLVSELESQREITSHYSHKIVSLGLQMAMNIHELLHYEATTCMLAL